MFPLSEFALDFPFRRVMLVAIFVFGLDWIPDLDLGQGAWERPPWGSGLLCKWTSRTASGQTVGVPQATLPAARQNPVHQSPAGRVMSVAEQLESDLKFLASDQLAGRSVADDSIDQAADYIAKRMTQIGLDTTVMDGTPFQPVSIELETQPGPAEQNWIRLSMVGDQDQPTANTEKQKTFAAKLGDGMMPMTVGKRLAQLSAPATFVGYGITAPEYGYDDYAGIDVGGHVVVMLRKEPQTTGPQSPFDGARNSKHAFFKTKIDNAIKNGAVAVVLVNDAASMKQVVGEHQQRIRREQKRRAALEKQLAQLPSEAVNNRKTIAQKIASLDQLVESMKAELVQKQRGLMSMQAAGSGKDDNKDTKVPVMSITRDLLDQMLRHHNGASLVETEKRINQTLKPQSVPFDQSTFELQVNLSPTARVSNNVIGVLPGRGSLADETVVVGAHYDHVGMGGVGSLAPGTIAIHNGADDNASGTSVLMATARVIKTRLSEVANHRRIVFIAFTGEERGLLGSEHYVRNPRFPLESTTAMINLDMVGRLHDNELTVYGTGSADGMDTILQQANVKPGFKLVKVTSGYGPSDHQSFYLRKVPVLFFFTGLHNDYHRPSDDFDKINFGGMARITDIVSESTFQLTVRPQRLPYRVTEKNARIRWQKTAFLGVSLSIDNDQVVISAVAPGQPADKAGVQAGDRLLLIAGRKIMQVSDVQTTLGGKQPGQKIQLQISRGEQTLDIPVTLGASQR